MTARDKARREAGTLSVALRVACDKRVKQVRAARGEGRHAVPVALDAIETDAAMMREAALLLAGYHDALGAIQGAEYIDFADAIGLEIVT